MSNFNLIPYDHEAYFVAADYAEEQGFILTIAIRNKILPLEIEKGNGQGNTVFNSTGGNYEGLGWGEGYASGEGDGFGTGYGRGWASGVGNGRGLGIGK